MISLDDRAFVAAYKALMQRWQKNSREGIRRYGDSVATFAKGHIHSVSSELADAVHVEDHLEEEPPYIEVGTAETGEDPHGLYTEFGTSKETARPYMRPALEEAFPDFTVDE